MNNPADFLPEAAISDQQKTQAASPESPPPAKASKAGLAPLKIDLTATEGHLDNDQPLEIATRCGTFSVPLWLTAEVMTEINTRHAVIESMPEESRPPGWTKTTWWEEVRQHFVKQGMSTDITTRELLLLWKHFWNTVRSLGKV